MTFYIIYFLNPRELLFLYLFKKIKFKEKSPLTVKKLLTSFSVMLVTLSSYSTFLIVFINRMFSGPLEE
ncbi:hypothetical protein H8957_016341, partial [Semnopithecus entellus]